MSKRRLEFHVPGIGSGAVRFIEDKNPSLRQVVSSYEITLP